MPITILEISAAADKYISAHSTEGLIEALIDSLLKAMPDLTGLLDLDVDEESGDKSLMLYARVKDRSISELRKVAQPINRILAGKHMTVFIAEAL